MSENPFPPTPMQPIPSFFPAGVSWARSRRFGIAMPAAVVAVRPLRKERRLEGRRCKFMR